MTSEIVCPGTISELDATDPVQIISEFLASRLVKPSPLSDEDFEVLKLLFESSQNDADCKCIASDETTNPLFMAFELQDERLVKLLLQSNSFACFEDLTFYNKAMKKAAEKNIIGVIDTLFVKLKQHLPDRKMSLDLQPALFSALSLDYIDCINKLLSLTEYLPYLKDTVGAIECYLSMIVSKTLIGNERPLTNEEMNIIETLNKSGCSQPYKPAMDYCTNFTHYNALEAAIILKDMTLYNFLLKQVPLDHIVSPESLSDVLATAAEDNFCDILAIVETVLKGNFNSVVVVNNLNTALGVGLRKNHSRFACRLMDLFPDFDLINAVDAVTQSGNLQLLQIIIAAHPGMFTSSIATAIGTHWVCYACCSANSFEIIEFLLESGAIPNWNNNLDKKSALFMAAKNGDCDYVNILIKHGACVCTSVANLVLQKERKYSEKMRYLILSQFTEKMFSEKSGESYPLSLAASLGDLNSVQNLVSNGFDVNYKHITKQTKFHVSTPKRNSPLIRAIQGKHVEVVEFMLSHGGDVNSKDVDGFPAIFSVANQELIPLLVDNGACVNTIVHDRSPLCQTVLNNRYAVFKALIEAGADVNVMVKRDNKFIRRRKDRKETLLSSLLYNIFHDAIDIRSHAHFVILLLEKGATPSSLSHRILGAIQLCIEYKEFPMMSALIRFAGISPTVNRSDWMALGILKSIADWEFKQIFSPFCMALLCGFPDLARDMRNAFYLTRSDLVTLPKNDYLKEVLAKKQRCLDMITEMGTYPPSLKMLSFVHVSDLLGPGLDRRGKVAQLGLPPHMQRCLLFTASDQKFAEEYTPTLEEGYAPDDPDFDHFINWPDADVVEEWGHESWYDDDTDEENDGIPSKFQRQLANMCSNLVEIRTDTAQTTALAYR